MISDIAAERNHIQNLDMLRLVFASLVTVSHSFPLTGTDEPLFNVVPVATGGSIAVQAFFFISGYLVTKSWFQTPHVKYFMIARFLRVWPALVCALILTIILAYFASPETDLVTYIKASARYFLNNLNLVDGVAYDIADAYSHQATNSVNGSLWTLPWEIRCYIGLIIVALLGFFSSRAIGNILYLHVVVLLVLGRESDIFSANSEIPLMIFAFCSGAFYFLNRSEFTPVQVGVVFLALAFVAVKYFDEKHFAVVLTTISLVLALGFSQKLKLPRLKTDLSYGIYVFSFPVQQFLVFSGVENPWLLALITLFIVAGLAYFSWVLVEKPAINYSKKFRS